jgi:hypothetical protein
VLWLLALLVFPFLATVIYFASHEELNPPATHTDSREVMVRLVLLSALPLVATLVTGIARRTRLDKLVAVSVLSGLWGYAFPFVLLVLFALAGLYRPS